MRTVGEVSGLAGVSVRTLHHYDELGLLSPSGRSDAGYRLYSHADLERLREILVWRGLGFPLAEIAALLDDPGHDRVAVLRAQRELVTAELTRLLALGQAIDDALAAQEGEAMIEEDQMFDGLHAYEDEARERWGETDAYRESSRRVSGYGEREWRSIREQSEEIEAGLAALLRAGEPATGEAARSIAELHRRHICTWFYDCPPAMHRKLGELYVGDPRFAAHYEEREPGLAAYLREAIAANADAGGAAEEPGS